MSVDRWDVAALAGLALVAEGIREIHMPSALIFVGIVCLAPAVAMFVARVRGR